MKGFPSILTIILTSTLFVVIASIFISAYTSVRKGQGLVNYFARLGIEVEYSAIIIALGMIPVFWLVAYVIRSWTMRWK